jgi:hypothetical protein
MQERRHRGELYNMVPAVNQAHKARTPGEVRVRSNVCREPNDWHLVPGDLLKSCDLPLHDLTAKQRDELMYYERCCLCQRTVFVFMQDGCDYCAIGGHGVPSVAESRRRREERFARDHQTQSSEL